ncbi:MAG: hypothetical protein HeimC3_31130 [Candidatus Heimdallarchaeota archaeon LC_3]|nr:MAG: hypothetical protein HeimC3_31130 [Candidatus Heimdallarchaeota archaeon LC_3]
MKILNNDFAFISYAFADKEIANSICSKLESENSKCWIAPRDVPAAENFPGAIIKALCECNSILFLFSQNVKNSQFILNELTNALNYDKTIITIRLEEIEPKGAINFFIGARNWIDIWDRPLDMNIKNIINAITNVKKKKITLVLISDQGLSAIT